MEASDAFRSLFKHSHALQRTGDHNGRSLRFLRILRRTKGKIRFKNTWITRFIKYMCVCVLMRKYGWGIHNKPQSIHAENIT